MSSLARIRFTCIHCNKKLSVLPAAAGRKLPCPNPLCGQPITVPPPDAIETAKPAGPAMPANVPTGTATTTASKPGAMVMIAAALSMFSLGAGLSYSLFKGNGNQERPEIQAVRVVERAEVEPKPDARQIEAKRKESQAEQAARKARNKTLAEYAALARTQSFEHYHNDRRVKPPEFDKPVFVKLARSDHADIRGVAESMMKGQAMVESLNAVNPIDASRQVLGGLMQDTPVPGQVYNMGGRTVISDSQDFANRFNQAASVAGKILRQQNANRAAAATLAEMDNDRKRITYQLARQLSGPFDPVGMQLKVQAFVRGEDVFRAIKDSPKAAYCITASGGQKLTHCTIAVVVRGKPVSEGIGPALDLDEITNAVLQPSPMDKVALYYIGEFNGRDKIHFLDLPAQVVKDNLERIGVVMFSDQMTLVGDPTAGFQEVRDKHLTQAGSNVENQTAPQNEAPSKRRPAARRPAGPQSSRRPAAKGAPRRN